MAIALALVSATAVAGPVLHERVPFDRQGDLPLVADPRALPPGSPWRTSDGSDPRRALPAAPIPGSGFDGAHGETFRPDRDTSRPDGLPYDDPFTPRTAPWKRLMAFDAVSADYTLIVHDPTTRPLPVRPAAGANEDHFVGDMSVEISPGKRTRIPSVGPGTRIVSARASDDAHEVHFSILRDGADNWFLEGPKEARARLVLEVSIDRAALGGDFGDPRWRDLATPPRLPLQVAARAEQVVRLIGLDRSLSPRENVARIVAYFRDFTDSAEPPRQTGDIYLDLALSKKGVCRHRAFAFLVTALAIGLPSRMVVNEAHAWVEVHNGAMWQRIDLGGAGRLLHDPAPEAARHVPPADPFAWPAGAARGDDLPRRSRQAAIDSRAAALPVPITTNAPPAGAPRGGHAPEAIVTVSLAASDLHRGKALKVTGTVTTLGEPCEQTAVAIVLRGAVVETPLGSAATDDAGAFSTEVVIPATLPVGDYDLVARTESGPRCGQGESR